MSDFTGTIIDWSEKLAEAIADPERHPTGGTKPPHRVSENVSVSRDRGLYVYHVSDGQLGQGASLGNSHAWAETKGNGHLLSLFSIQAGMRMLGGMSLTYQMPFNELSAIGRSATQATELEHNRFARIMPRDEGQMHLHPACQQRAFILAEGLHVLETLYLPRTGSDHDPSAVCTAVALWNRMPYPIRITLVATVDLLGRTPRDLRARYEASDLVLLAHNAGKPAHVRFLGADRKPEHYWATCQQEAAYNPHDDLPDRTDEQGELIGAMQFDLLLAPGQQRKVRILAGFSLAGEDDARTGFRQLRDDSNALNQTIDHYREALDVAEVEVPDELLSEGAQWAKACMLRPLARYGDRWCFTNDPGHSSHLVGRDVAWYTHGCDFAWPERSCEMLGLLVEKQREDGLIAEHIDSLTGEAVFHDFNINDNTPLFILAAAHHVAITGHDHCLRHLYEPVRRAAALILAQRDEQGLVRCTADGEGVRGICGWRNALSHGQISGAVTEVNSECFAALHAAAELAERADDPDAARRYRREADVLRDRIHEHLVDPRTGLYVRNIDHLGQAHTQASSDLAFPLMFGVADEARQAAISARLFAPDFMSSGGLRVLPNENPRYDSSENAGLLGGVWPGVTWWFSMGCARSNPGITAESLRRSYAYLVRNPLMFDTVPGQFNEWSDGQTLVNRGMRLSPWAPPRFLWAMIEGMVGLSVDGEQVRVQPNVPRKWQWLRVGRLPVRGKQVAFVAVREGDQMRLVTCCDIDSPLSIERYERELEGAVETLAVGVAATAFARNNELLVFLGNSQAHLLTCPTLLHRLLDAGMRYRVRRCDSIEARWQHMGEIRGTELQRVAVRLEPHGYGLYHFAAAA